MLDVSERSRRVPHYALKTVTHSAPEFANHEQDVIRQSFSTGNHTWMKEALPVELGPDAVNLLRRQRMERNRLAEPLPQTWSKMTQLWGGGYYPEFEYIPDAYERKEEMERSTRQGSVSKREKISTSDWRHTSQEKRMKHETMLNDPRNKEVFPYLGGDKSAELQTAKQWLRTSAPLTNRPRALSQEQQSAGSEGSFLAGKGRGLEEDSKTSRMTLPTIVQRLQRRMDLDWEDTIVVVSATDQDLVQVAFHMQSVDSERGVLAYMNVLAKDTELLGNLGLRKVSQLWGMRRDFSAEIVPSVGGQSTPEGDVALEHTWMFFLLMPRWVRMRPTDAYYTVHPRTNGSAFRMSTAGSSVLLSLGTSLFDPGETARRTGVLGGGCASAPPAELSERRQAQSGAVTARPLPVAPAAGRVDLSLIEKAVGGLPAIKECRSARG